MPFLFTVLLLFVFLPLLIAALIVPFQVVRARYVRFVEENSLLLRQLDELNKRYVFHEIHPTALFHRYDNADLYDAVSCEDYLIYDLQTSKDKIREQIRAAHANAELYSRYRAELAELTEWGKYAAPTTSYSNNRLRTYEKEAYRRRVQDPYRTFYVSVRLRNTSDDGGRQKKSKDFFPDEILALIRRVENKNGRFFNDRGIWDAIVRVERGKVSNKLRFAVYRRDHERCCRCGRPDRPGNRLEIDHVIPISKGGKSTMDNLQTLCHECNVQKGSDVDFF